MTMDRKCVSLRYQGSSRRMEDTLGKTFLRYQQQRGQCPCRDCVAHTKHFTIRVHKMLEVQSLYKPTPHQPSAKRRRLRLTSVPLVDLRVPPSEGSGVGDSSDFYGSLHSPPRSLSSDVDASSISSKSGICSVSESMDTPKSGTSSIRIKHLTSSWESESRFPKLNECAHFHYEFVELGPINVCIFDEAQENSKLLANGALEKGSNFAVQVSSNGKSWVVRRSYENFRMLDQQLHQCIYDRKFSALHEIPKEWHVVDDDEPANSKENITLDFSEYLQRFSDIAGNLINCGPILNWLELDNRGNRLIVTDDSAINTPAVAAAYVTKRYIAQATDEISFEVGDMISVIDMPPPEESIWWRGKRGFEVGFFPSECVEVIGDKVPHSIHIPKAPTKPVLRKHGKLIAFFRSFILSRPSRRKLKQSGILKERVFGCDLGEHLLNSGRDIPMVLKCCSEFIEAHGIVDGIYRLSGVTSNIQKLRNTFDEERVPDLNDEAILHDIHCVASLLKMYFRELPNPLLTYQLYDKFVSGVQSDDDVRLLNVRDVVQQLPPPHYRTLEYLVRHLSRVAAHGAETGMTPKNVAIVWAPNLLRSKDLEIGGVAALQVVGVQAVVTEFLIHYSDLIFNDKMPAFSPCLESTGTPKRNRPKSLAISTPTKLLSLEEARSRALGAIQYNQKYIEVGGGPSMLPNKYHTVIELPDRKRSSSKHKKSPSGWKSFFSKGKSTQQSVRDRDKSKSRRKGSSTPSDPGISIGLTDKAVTETDVSRNNNNRLRSVKSAESLISSAANSQRNSDAIDSANANIDVTGSEDLLSSSLGAVSSAQLRQSPHSHIRSISHDSYFEFSFDRQQRGDRRPGELATITSEENDEEQERIVLDDFIRMHYVDQDSESSVTCRTDEAHDSTLNEMTTIGTSGTDKLTSSSTPVYVAIRDGADDSEDTLNKFGTETLQEQSSIDSDDDHSDIVGDIEQEVAAALHWDQPSYSHMNSGAFVASPKRDNSSMSSKSPVSGHTRKGHPDSRVIVERYGSEKTVIVEVHATKESSSEDDADVAYLSLNNIIHSDVDSLSSVSPTTLPIVSTVTVSPAVDGCQVTSVSQNDFPASSLVLYDSLEAGQVNLVCESNSVVCDRDFSSEISGGFCPDSLEYDDFSCNNVGNLVNVSATCQNGLDPDNGELSKDETISDSFSSVSDLQKESVNVITAVKDSPQQSTEECADDHLIQVCDSSSNLAPADENEWKGVAEDGYNTTVVIISSRGIDLLTGDDAGSDSSHGGTNGEISSTSSPGSSHDPFAYSVLVNEEENTPIKEDLIQLNLEVHPPVVVQSNVNDDISEDWVVVDAGNDGIEVKILSNNQSTDNIKMVTDASYFNKCDHASLVSGAAPFFNSDTTPAHLSNLPTSECEHSNSAQRQSYLEKMSPVEESKRKFESEIGRDILRERKMKLELEKIQLEQQRCDNKSWTSSSSSPRRSVVSGETLSSPVEPCVKSNVDVDSKIMVADSVVNDVDVEDVELRQQSVRDCSVLEDSKRTSEPASTSTKSDVVPVRSEGNKRHSEPSFKSSRPERKASVKELMSKFEKKPKKESPNSNMVSDQRISDSSPSKALLDPLPIKPALAVENSVVQDSPHVVYVEQDAKNVAMESMATSVSRSEESLESERQRSVHAQSPTEENSLMTMSLEGGLDKQVYDQARRERIDRYKEERRAQLRERIRSESFREQETASDYILRLKQKTTSPVKLASSSDKADDGCGFPVSPRRRARLSAVAFVHSTDDYKPDSYLSRRRSFNSRSSPASSSLTSPTSSGDSISSIVSDWSRLRDKSVNQKAAISTEQHQEGAGMSLEGPETLIQSVESSAHKSVTARPKDLHSHRIDHTPGTVRTSVQKKSSPADGPTSNRIKSPMKERSNNVPLSPTMDILTANNDGTCVKKDSRLRYSDKDNENPARTKCLKASGPTPPPRKIKDVAALFEPERLPKQPDSRKEAQHEESDQRIRAHQRPFSTHVQSRLKTVSSCKEDEGNSFAFPSSSLSTTSSVHKLKPKKQNTP